MEFEIYECGHVVFSYEAVLNSNGLREDPYVILFFPLVFLFSLSLPLLENEGIAASCWKMG